MLRVSHSPNLWDVVVNTKTGGQTFRHQRRTLKEDNSAFSLSPPSVMVPLTSVSPLLYATPDISRQMASLINTDSDIRSTQARAPSPDPPQPPQ